MRNALMIMMIALSLVGCSENATSFPKTSPSSPNVDINDLEGSKKHKDLEASLKSVDLCPGLDLTGWGGSDLQRETGIIFNGELVANVQTVSGYAMGFTKVPTVVFCDELHLLPEDTTGLNSIQNQCDDLTEGKIGYVNNRAYHLGTGNFATIQECLFKYINDTVNSEIIIQRIQERDDDPMQQVQPLIVLDEEVTPYP